MKNFITKEMQTETGHRLVNYNGKCAHLHGHTYRWEVTVQCAAKEFFLQNGMIMDFKDLKMIMETCIGRWDHAFLFCRSDPLVVSLLSAQEDPAVNVMGRLQRILRGTDHELGRVFAYPWNPTVEAMASFQFHNIQASLDVGRKARLHRAYLKRVRVWETATSFAEVEIENALLKE